MKLYIINSKSIYNDFVSHASVCVNLRQQNVQYSKTIALNYWLQNVLHLEFAYAIVIA